MSEIQVSIGRVKRDISELVNRVAYGGDRIVLTSRGKAKAVLVSIEDYEHLRAGDIHGRLEQFENWLQRANDLSSAILARRGRHTIDVDELMRKDREDREARSDWVRSDH
ncbi:MAG TPA: type II toxin-antitoxin system Phd/YefM family antitoxin [Dehalococcoidia bacterium]|nr:type II toxin-antitoxin system Phd/YefM family antitoxin [Dehalococcoidia bacterium]